MIDIRLILATTDFSEHSALAVQAACQLSARLGAELHLLHVLSEIIPAGPDPLLTPILPAEYYTDAEEKARETLERFLDPTWSQPRSVSRFVRWGSPVEAIVDHARDHPVDLIVIASHGRTGLKHALLGSVAERIVRESPCPVLTIRDRDRDRVGSPAVSTP